MSNSDSENSQDDQKAKKKNYDYLLKIVLVGEPNIGKTSLLVRYMRGDFEDSAKQKVINQDFLEKIIDYDGLKLRVQVWDTAGQEKFRAITSSYYRKADGVIICFAIDNQKTFEAANNWVDEILKYGEANVDRKLVGLRTDLKKDVDSAAIEKLAKDLSLPYEETSAKDNINVEKCFADLISTILERRVGKANTMNNGKRVKKNPKNQNNKGNKGGCNI